MAKKVSAAEAKAKLSSLVAEVAFGGQHVIIERRGKPLAALINISDLEQLEQDHAISAKPRGALALVGAWKDVPEKDIDMVLSNIYRSREKDMGRPVQMEV